LSRTSNTRRAVLGGNVRTPSIARWKSSSRLPIRHNWTFSLSLKVETL